MVIFAAAVHCFQSHLLCFIFVKGMDLPYQLSIVGEIWWQGLYIESYLFLGKGQVTLNLCGSLHDGTHFEVNLSL